MTIYYTYCSYETDKGDAGLMYIGCRKCPENKTPWTDNYFGSQKSKKGQDFKNNPNKSKFVLGVFNNHESAIAHEIELHEANGVAVDPRFANQAKQTSTGFSTSGVRHSEETRRKWSEARSGDRHPMFGKNHSPETCQKVSRANKGKKRSPETRQQKSESMKGKKNHFFGKKHSPEACQKIVENRRRYVGEGNPNFDHTLFNFENRRLRVVEIQVTRYHLSQRYDLSSKILGYVVKGKQLSHKGWTLMEEQSYQGVK